MSGPTASHTYFPVSNDRSVTEASNSYESQGLTLYDDVENATPGSFSIDDYA